MSENVKIFSELIDVHSLIKQVTDLRISTILKDDEIFDLTKKRINEYIAELKDDMKQYIDTKKEDFILWVIQIAKPTLTTCKKDIESVRIDGTPFETETTYKKDIEINSAPLQTEKRKDGNSSTLAMSSGNSTRKRKKDTEEMIKTQSIKRRRHTFNVHVENLDIEVEENDFGLAKVNFSKQFCCVLGPSPLKVKGKNQWRQTNEKVTTFYCGCGEEDDFYFQLRHNSKDVSIVHNKKSFRFKTFTTKEMAKKISKHFIPVHDAYCTDAVQEKLEGQNNILQLQQSKVQNTKDKEVTVTPEEVRIVTNMKHNFSEVVSGSVNNDITERSTIVLEDDFTLPKKQLPEFFQTFSIFEQKENIKIQNTTGTVEKEDKPPNMIKGASVKKAHTTINQGRMVINNTSMQETKQTNLPTIEKDYEKQTLTVYNDEGIKVKDVTEGVMDVQYPEINCNANVAVPWAMIWQTEEETHQRRFVNTEGTKDCRFMSETNSKAATKTTTMRDDTTAEDCKPIEVATENVLPEDESEAEPKSANLVKKQKTNTNGKVNSTVNCPNEFHEDILVSCINDRDTEVLTKGTTEQVIQISCNDRDRLPFDVTSNKVDKSNHTSSSDDSSVKVLFTTTASSAEREEQEEEADNKGKSSIGNVPPPATTESSTTREAFMKVDTSNGDVTRTLRSTVAVSGNSNDIETSEVKQQTKKVTRTLHKKTERIITEDEKLSYISENMVELHVMTMALGYTKLVYPQPDNKKTIDSRVLVENQVNTLCCICSTPFHIGDKACRNLNCQSSDSTKHYLCQPCSYQFCLNVPKPEDYLKVKKIAYSPLWCPICKQRGIFTKRHMDPNQPSTSTDDWKYGEDIRFLQERHYVVGTHQRSGFCNWIVDKKLMIAIQLSEATQKQVDYVEVRDKTSNELELYDRYITMTLKKFKCAECSEEVSNAECCKIKDCSPTCLYKLCRSCFAETILSRKPLDKKPTESYFKGLYCDECGVIGFGFNPYSKKYWCKKLN